MTFLIWDIAANRIALECMTAQCARLHAKPLRLVCAFPAEMGINLYTSPILSTAQLLEAHQRWTEHERLCNLEHDKR